jgi:hypothetical protein
MLAINHDAISLFLPENLSVEAYRDIGAQLGRACSRLNWLIGDWWAFGDARYGERKAIVAADDWTGPSYERCMNVASVCRRFEPSRRREVLSFQHHAEVETLPPEIADELLDWCLKDMAESGRPRSVRQLRERVNEYGRAVMDKAIERARARDLATSTPLTFEVSIREEPAKGKLVTIRPPTSEVALDTSAVDGTMPSEVTALQPDPLVAVDRVATAKAAIAGLGFAEALALVTDWHRDLSPDQQGAVVAALGRNRRGHKVG